MKSERPDLALTIARLARGATPVTPLEAPWVRLSRWVGVSMAIALLLVVVRGVRADVAAQMLNGWFVARAAATIAVACAAAIAAFQLSVPGTGRSRLLRALPVTTSLVWAMMLAGAIAVARSPLHLLLSTAPHPSCALLVAVTAFLPGVILVRMLRHAAPLAARWEAGLAALASLAVGALGAQFVCANDGGGHQLLWHFTPVVVLTLAAIAAGTSLFGRPHRPFA